MNASYLPSPPSFFHRQIALKGYSTFAIGGCARWLALITSKEEMAEALVWCEKTKTPYLVIGRGSNLLFDDRGFDGAVLVNKIGGYSLKGSLLTVGAGFSFARLGVITSRAHLAGLEFACGIPGTVGGAVAMNAGANGQQTADVLHSVDLLDERANLITVPRSQLSFAYRSSPFQCGFKGAVIGAAFHLTPCEKALQRQKELLIARRMQQPYHQPSAGCIFRNPSGESAGRLIELLGFKGSRCGGAEVSFMHANFIVNTGQATAKEVKELIDLIARKMAEEKKIELVTEIHIVPYQSEQVKDGYDL